MLMLKLRRKQSWHYLIKPAPLYEEICMGSGGMRERKSCISNREEMTDQSLPPLQAQWCWFSGGEAWQTTSVLLDQIQQWSFFFFFNMWRLSSNSVQDVYSWQHCSAYTASHWQSVFNVFHAHSLPVRQRSAITVLSPCIYSTEGLSDPSNVIKNYMPEQEFGSGHLSPSQPLPSDGFVSTHLALQQPRELLAL